MYNAKYIWPGVIAFLALFTAPFWLNVGSGKYAYPDVAVPKAKAASVEAWAQKPQAERLAEPGTACIMPKEYMRAEHMQILNTWRDQALREEKREYTGADGAKWEVSLQNTCMKCHTNKVEFCDKCHDSNSVSPYCWDCHVAPKGNE